MRWRKKKTPMHDTRFLYNCVLFVPHALHHSLTHPKRVGRTKTMCISAFHNTIFNYDFEWQNKQLNAGMPFVQKISAPMRWWKPFASSLSERRKKKHILCPLRCTSSNFWWQKRSDKTKITSCQRKKERKKIGNPQTNRWKRERKCWIQYNAEWHRLNRKWNSKLSPNQCSLSFGLWHDCE